MKYFIVRFFLALLAFGFGFSCHAESPVRTPKALALPSNRAFIRCEEFLKAEKESDWKKCFSMLHEDVAKIASIASNLAIYEGPVEYSKDSTERRPNEISIFGKDMEICFVKYWKPIDDEKAFTSIFFVLKKDRVTGKWAVYNVYPSKLSLVFSKVLTD